MYLPWSELAVPACASSLLPLFLVAASWWPIAQPAAAPRSVVVTGDMPGRTADDGAFDAAFGIGRNGRHGDRQRQTPQYRAIAFMSIEPLLVAAQSAASGFRSTGLTRDGRLRHFSLRAIWRGYFGAIVITGVIASGIDLEPYDRRLAGSLGLTGTPPGKSSVRSTDTPKPPKARA